MAVQAYVSPLARRISAGDVPWAALAPVLALLLAFVVYCLVDMARGEVKYLPKWAWALICFASVPFGGIIYLLVGRRR
jgi:uncharacterized integral membrane protein